MTDIAYRRHTSLKIDTGVLGMAIFLMTEVMLFAGLISACIVLRAGSPDPWPGVDQPRLPNAVTLGNAVLLVISGMVLSLARGRRSYVGVAVLLGAIFFAVQGYEWSRLISFGLFHARTPYTGVFYALIGTHALHVIGGLIALGYGFTQLARGRDVIKVCGMYWYLVVAVWPILYFLVYF